MEVVVGMGGGRVGDPVVGSRLIGGGFFLGVSFRVDIWEFELWVSFWY